MICKKEVATSEETKVFLHKWQENFQFAKLAMPQSFHQPTRIENRWKSESEDDATTKLTKSFKGKWFYFWQARSHASRMGAKSTWCSDSSEPQHGSKSRTTVLCTTDSSYVWSACMPDIQPNTATSDRETPPNTAWYRTRNRCSTKQYTRVGRSKEQGKRLQKLTNLR